MARELVSPQQPALHQPQVPAKRRSCDWCRNSKEKCRWLTAATCERCRRLKISCQSNKPARKRGRKPRRPSGNQMCLISSSSLRGLAFIPALPGEESPPAALEDTTSSPFHASTNLVCREPSPYERVVLFPDLSHLEARLLDVALQNEVEIDRYMVGPTAVKNQRYEWVAHARLGLVALKDALIAAASVISRDEHLKEQAVSLRVGFRRSAAAIASLPVVYSKEDLSVLLLLGVGVNTFALNQVCGPPQPLCEYILDQAKPFAGQTLDSFQIACLSSLLNQQTTLCLISGHMPTIQIRDYKVDKCVDRYAGISLPVLGYLYDVCELAVVLRNARRDQHAAHLPDTHLQTRLQELETSIQSWESAVPLSLLLNDLSVGEISLMISQAELLRLAALLVLHRLRYPYGTQDEKAAAMSREILETLDSGVKHVGRSIPQIEIPHLAACFELTNQHDRDSRLVQSHDIIDFSPYVLQRHKTWLRRFWQARDNTSSGDCLYWHDLQFLL